MKETLITFAIAFTWLLYESTMRSVPKIIDQDTNTDADWDTN